MEKIFIVTGATGFVGNNVVKELEYRGESVVAMARSEKKVAEALKNTNAKIVYGDVLDGEKIEELFRVAAEKKTETEICFIHAASVVYLGGNKEKIAQMFDVNLNGTKNVIEACLKHKCRLLYVSSVHAITEPRGGALTTEICDFDAGKVVGKYAKSKATASAMVMEAVKNRGLDAVLVHPSGIIGPGDYSCTHMTQMVQDYKNGRIPVATGGGYDFVDVRDVAAGILAACDKKRTKSGDCFLLSNRYVSVKELLDCLYELGGGKKVKFKCPRVMAKMALPVLALHHKISKTRPLYSSYSLYTLGSNSNFSHERADKVLDYKVRELKDSLRDTLNFLEGWK